MLVAIVKTNCHEVNELLSFVSSQLGPFVDSKHDQIIVSTV